MIIHFHRKDGKHTAIEAPGRPVLSSNVLKATTDWIFSPDANLENIPAITASALGFRTDTPKTL